VAPAARAGHDRNARFVVTIDGLVQAEPGSSIRFGLRPGWLYGLDASNHALGRV
jgi:hypothetical protein